MHSFYTPQLSEKSQTIILDDPDEIHHLKDVLRLKAGQAIQLFNGRSHKAEGVISDMASTQISIRVDKITEERPALPLLILACAVPKKGKFETIIEKTTELGVDEIIPLRTKNTEVIFKSEKLILKTQRFQKIALNAAKQSKRSTIPIIHPMTDFERAVPMLLKRSVVIIPSLTDNRTKIIPALENLNSPAAVSCLIGPEGDFTPQEYALAHTSGCLPVSLGQTILKVETAAITSVAITRLFFNG
ncbi:MAG: 16S rRNA (uracil(1498)-N(3))-methyltransferase [Candidatus Omnitrophota bacterium]